MVTIVIPTYNRAHLLAQVLPTYLRQESLGEIIIVNDASTTGNEAYARLAQSLPRVRMVTAERHLGAPGCRKLGYERAGNEYVMFGEDDVFLQDGYVSTLLRKIDDLGAVSGRLITLRNLEKPEEALARFGNGWKRTGPFDRRLFSLEEEALFEGDISVPLTHALFLTSRSLLLQYGYDPRYSRGNGFREESDFLVALYVHGKKIVITNETHCFHMSRGASNAGGQRIPKIARLYWNVHYTNYMYKKYFGCLRQSLSLGPCRLWAVATYMFWFIVRSVLRAGERRVGG